MGREDPFVCDNCGFESYSFTFEYVSECEKCGTGFCSECTSEIDGEYSDSWVFCQSCTGSVPRDIENHTTASKLLLIAAELYHFEPEELFRREIWAKKIAPELCNSLIEDADSVELLFSEDSPSSAMIIFEDWFGGALKIPSKSEARHSLFDRLAEVTNNLECAKALSRILLATPLKG